MHVALESGEGLEYTNREGLWEGGSIGTALGGVISHAGRRPSGVVALKSLMLLLVIIHALLYE